MKIACVHHSIDLDGWMSAAVVLKWFIDKMNTETGNHEIEFIGYNYGDPIPDMKEYDKVIMCDISFPKEEMKNLEFTLEYGNPEDKNFIWIDHHISAINDNIDRNFHGLRDTNFAACELTWKFFFPNDPMPELVRLLGRYDCFGHKGTDEELKVLQFQYGARQRISNYREAYTYLYNHLEAEKGAMLNFKNSIDGILQDGVAIYNYLCTEAKQSYKNGFAIEFDNPKWDTVEHYPGMPLKLKFICINKERFNPVNFGIDYHADGYDGAACFHYANGMWNFSLYNDNEQVNCSLIAKQFGGGGHKGAAGFKIKNIESILNKAL